MRIVGNVVNWLTVELEDMRMKMDGARLITVVPNELRAQTSQGALEAWRRGFRVYDNHFADGKTFLEKEIERESDDLWLATQGRQ